jgi:GNAT superfamily N-acetyltransferase
MISIRPVRLDDVPLLKTLIYEFAEFERELDQVQITEEDLRRDGFGPEAKFRSLMVDWEGEVAGYAIFFPIFSTWEGRSALFLEDLYVRPRFRGKGIGKSVLAHLAAIARQEKCFGMKWEVLDWNQPAIEFYRSIGARFMENRRVFLFSGEAFDQMAAAAHASPPPHEKRLA